MNSNVRDTGNFFLNAPAALVTNSAAITVANATSSFMTFDTERYDNDTIHSTTSLTGRLVCVTPGVYCIAGYLQFAANATGNRHLTVRLNGTTTIREVNSVAVSGIFTNLAVCFDYKLALNDYVELGVFQGSGGALAVTPEFGMTWKSAG